MTKVESANPVVNSAIAANVPWGGNLYKCPYCGSSNRKSYDGRCKKCKRVLPPDVMGKFVSERIKRSFGRIPAQETRGVHKRKDTGPIDIPAKTKRHIGTKHPHEIPSIGMTLVKGKFGRTTVGSLPGRPVSGKRMSGVHRGHLVYVEKDKGRSALKTAFKGRGKAKTERAIHKETRRK